MAFFRKAPSRKVLQEQIDTCRLDVETLRQEIGGMREEIEGELERLRKDFHELILFLKESTADDPVEAEAPGTGAGVAETAAGLQGDLATLAEQVASLSQQDAAVSGALQQLQTMIETGFGEMEKQLTDARKEIAKRISYTVSRLRA